MLSLESELKGKLSSGNLLALVSGKPMSSGSIFLSIRACAYWSETLTYSSGGSSREGLDLGGSFGRFLVARRFGRKLQTTFIGFGKGQGQILSSRLRVLFGKPSPRYRVACPADTDSDVDCGRDVHLLWLIPAHCTGEHFAIADGRRFGWWLGEEPVLKLEEIVGALHCHQPLGIHAKFLDALCYRWLACEPLSALGRAIGAKACFFVCLGGDGPRGDGLCEYFVADVFESHGAGISQN